MGASAWTKNAAPCSGLEIKAAWKNPIVVAIPMSEGRPLVPSSRREKPNRTAGVKNNAALMKEPVMIAYDGLEISVAGR